MYEEQLAPDADLLVVPPRTRVPELMVALEPGAELGLMLEAVSDRSVLDGSELVTLLQARSRQIAHLQAQQMADLVAIAGRCHTRLAWDREDSSEEPFDYASDEIASAMTWTYKAADVQLAFAERLVGELPEVHAAMLDGLIDWPKAKAFSDALQTCTPEVARRVIAAELPGAGRRTTGQLRPRLHKLVMRLDPEAATRRYRKGVKQRRFEFGRDDDGTASLTARHLPADRAAAVNARIQAIADEAKDQGDQRSIDQLRADTMLDLLQGLPVPGFDGQDARPIPGDPHHHEDTKASGRRTRRKGRRRVGPRGACQTCGQTKLNRGLELTVPLTTLMRLSESPGALGSFGPLVAEATRALAKDLHNTPWKISMTDQHGHVIWHGPIRSRPDPDDSRRFPTQSQAAFVRARDRKCRFPGCRRPASRAEIDHGQPHAHGGPTHICNLQCLCARHHALKTAGIWKAELRDNGLVIWTSPLGRRYFTYPEPPDD